MRWPGRRADGAAADAEKKDDRNVGPARKCDADLRLCERRSVVHTIARHRDDLAFRLQLLYLRCLILGHHLREDLIDAELFRNRFGRLTIIAGHHYDLDLLPVEFVDRGLRRWFDRIRNTDETGVGSIDHDRYNRLPRGPQLLGDLVVADEAEQVGDLELAAERRAVLALSDRFRPLPGAEIVPHDQAKWHVGRDHLPGSARCLQRPLQPA